MSKAARGLQENPKRPPREWWYRCVKGVEEKGGAYDPQSVCGSLWYHKLSAADRRRITKESEDMKTNPAPNVSANPTEKPVFHVYAEDGFESSHRSLNEAIRAAKRGAKLRGLEYRVYKTDVYGKTGPRRGETVWSSGLRDNPSDGLVTAGIVGGLAAVAVWAFWPKEKKSEKCAVDIDKLNDWGNENNYAVMALFTATPLPKNWDELKELIAQTGGDPEKLEQAQAVVVHKDTFYSFSSGAPVESQELRTSYCAFST